MDNLRDLERRAATHDPEALTALGRLALIGQAGGRSPNDGAALLAQAAEAGSAEADSTIAVLIGADARSATDWDLALGYMERAAWRGWEPARRQLAMLCRNSALAAQALSPDAPADIWRTVKQAIDIQELARSPLPKTIFHAPHIAVVEGFATSAECDWMISRASPRITRAPVFDQQHGGAQYDNSRTNSAFLFDILEADFALIVLRARIAATTGVDVHCFEETNVLHYAPGEQFSRHGDAFDPKQPALAREIAEKGQRAVTFLIYLNDDFEGGETAFLNLGWQFKGRRGDAILFRNVDASGAPDFATIHAGLPTRTGEKWIVSQWIRSHPPRRAPF